MNLRRWVDDRPFLLAVVVMLAMFLPGLAVMGHTARVANEAADTAKAEADQNEVVVSCVTAWVVELTDALQDRDAVNHTARAAEREAWSTFRRLIGNEPPAHNARAVMIRSISRYLSILDRLENTVSVNPYPDIADCLSAEEIANALGQAEDVVEARETIKPGTMTYQLVAAHPGRIKCAGHATTIRGSNLDDNIRGTDGDDVIRTFKGDDLIIGGAGDDIICGGRGNDTINGGRGHDHGRGQAGSDFCVQTERERSC